MNLVHRLVGWVEGFGARRYDVDSDPYTQRRLADKAEAEQKLAAIRERDDKSFMHQHMHGTYRKERER